MKLLLDQNLSPRLVLALGDIYLGSLHVQKVNLDEEKRRLSRKVGGTSYLPL